MPSSTVVTSRISKSEEQAPPAAGASGSVRVNILPRGLPGTYFGNQASFTVWLVIVASPEGGTTRCVRWRQDARRGTGKEKENDIESQEGYYQWWARAAINVCGSSRPGQSKGHYVRSCVFSRKQLPPPKLYQIHILVRVWFRKDF